MPIGGVISNYPSGFANGLSVRGMPLLQMQPGNVFWLDNSTVLNVGANGASDGNRGTYLSPFSTLQYALDSCTHERGDIIFVGAGHKENIANATGLVFNKAGVAIVGLGSGSLRPTFTFTTATTANIPVRAANMSIQNCVFLFNFAAVASAFTGISASTTASVAATTMTVTVLGSGTVYPGATIMGTSVLTGTTILSQLTGTAGGVGTYQVSRSGTVASTTITTGSQDFAIENCEFRDLSASLNGVAIYTASASANASSGLSFTNNRISSLGTTALTTAIKVGVAQDRMTIKYNYGNWAAVNDTPAMLEAGSFNITNFDFGYNVLNRPNTSSTGGSFVGCSGTAWTGHCYNNLLWQLDNSAGIWIGTGTKLAFSQNFSPITGVADASGLINPAAV